MKKPTISSIFFSALVLLSLTCYLFLQVTASNSAFHSSETIEIAETQKVAVEGGGNFFNGISLLKRVVNISKIALPKD